MPRFHRLGTRDVVLGQADNGGSQVDCAELLRLAPSGCITLAKDDDPDVVERRLRRAARALRIRIRCSWADRTRRVLRWRRVSE